MPDSIIWVKFADSIKVRYILNYYLLTMTKIKSLDELRQKKQQLEQSLEIREKSDHPESMIQVRVAMATCGIASGARTVMNAFVEKIEAGNFVLAHWSGDAKVEAEIKELTGATIRCVPFEQPEEEGVCIKSGKASHKRVVFAKSY